MAELPKRYIREIRGKLSRFPTWPLVENVSLGLIGFFDGRAATFDWKKSLQDFSIEVTTIPPLNQINELYTSKGAVTFTFAGGAGSLGTANFGFRQEGAVATQSYELMLTRLELGSLERELVKRFRAKKIEWKRNWVIVTGVFSAASFTALISGGRGSKAELSTTIPIEGLVFNIADPTIGLGVANSDKMEYSAVAERELKPFFEVHKLIFPKGRDPYLKVYGKQGLLGGWS